MNNYWHILIFAVFFCAGCADYDDFKDLPKDIKFACSKTVVTFIDDDTNDLASIERYFNACNEVGIKGCFAVLTTRFTFAGIKEKLLYYDSQGFDCIIHGYDQNEYFRRNPITGEPPNYTLAEENLIRGLQDMDDAGFKDYQYWCTPYGAKEPQLQQMAQRHGMHCLISSGMHSPNNNNRSSSRWALSRCSFNPDKHGSDSVLVRMKKIVDNTAKQKAWLLVTTHMAQSEWKDPKQLDKFKSLIYYIREKGCEIMPIRRAWEFKKPIYDYYNI